MALPKELYESKKASHYNYMVQLANHIQKTIVIRAFMGDNYEAFSATLQELARTVKEFEKLYKDDFFIPEEPGMKSLSDHIGLRKLEMHVNGAA